MRKAALTSSQLTQPIRRRLGLDIQLEDRTVPALGNPTWQALPVGPGNGFGIPLISGVQPGQSPVSQGPSSGAIRSILVNPTIPDIIYVGTANGGVWRTFNGTSTNPIWTPLTDSQASLAIGDLAFGYTATGAVDTNTIYVGTGNFSSAARLGGQPGGVLKSTNGGATWTQLGATNFAPGVQVTVQSGGTYTLNNGVDINKILPTLLGGGQTILASTNWGLYRSTDGGSTWARLSGDGTSGLPETGVTDLIADPSNTSSSSRFYAAVAGASNSINNPTGQPVTNPGIYVSSDGGVTWQLTANQPTGIASSARIRLSASNGGGTTGVFAALVNSSGFLTGVFRTSNGGTSWTSLSVPANSSNPAQGITPGAQGLSNLAFVADPSNSNVVFIAGDRQSTYVFPYGWTGNVYRGDASQPSASVWTNVALSGASGTAPHADSRNMVFDSTGNLIEADDGGLYKLTNPNSTSRVWSSLNGAGPTGIQAYELYSIAYTQTNGTVLNGAQDNGTPAQNSVTSGVSLSNDITGGDGTIVQAAYDPTSRTTTQYFSSQNLGGFSRRTVNPDGSISSAQPLQLLVNGTTGGPATDGGLQTLSQVEGVNPRPANAAAQYASNPNGGIAFLQQYAVDTVNPARLIIATNSLYESTNGGDNLTQITNLNGQTTFPGRVSAIAYGGMLNGVANADVAWIGVNASNVGQLYLRSAANGAFALVNAYTGAPPVSIAMDQDNWQRAYVLDSRNQVWQTTNGGQTFTNLTTPALTALLPAPLTFRQVAFSIAVFPNTTAAGDEAIFVGGPGGVYGTDLTSSNQTSWVKFGSALPNVAVTGLAYNASANVLVASTLGRGDWQVTQLSNFANATAPIVTLNGAAANNSATFTQGGAAVVLALNATVTSTAQIQSLQLTISNLRDGTAESLSAVTAGTNITATYNATTGVLTLSGADTTANYQQVLRTVTYNNTSSAPSPVSRIINVVAITAGSRSQVAVNTLTVTAVNSTPVTRLNGAAGADVITNVNANSGATAIAPQATITSNVNLTSLTVSINDGTAVPVVAEGLSAVTTGTNITAAYNPDTRVLTLSGNDTVANYQQVLRTVGYYYLAPAAIVRKLTVSATNTAGTGAGANADIVIQLVNNAPVIDNSSSFNLPTYTQGTAGPAGVEVNTFLGKNTARPRITDRDAGAVGGIAVIGADQSNGIWQYSLDGGNTWVAFGAVSATQSLLLGDTEGNQIRFLPNAGYAGTSTFTFRGWDQTNGRPNVQVQEGDGAYADTTRNGGSTAYSSAVGTAKATVVIPTPVSPPPVSPPPVSPPPVSPPPVAPTNALIAIGAGAGGSPRVQVYNARTKGMVLDFLAYSASFTGGVRTAVGDLNGDGTDDIVCGAGAGGGPDVRVFDGKTGKLIHQFMAFQTNFTGGVTVAVGDVNGDGTPDIIVGAGTGGGPRVRVFDGKTGASIADFYAYTPAFTGGVNVAVGDVNKDGRADIITGTQTGAPHVKVFSGANLSLLYSFYAFSPSFSGGVSVAGGDVNGDGLVDIITGAGAGGTPQVNIYNGGTGALYGTFQAYNSSYSGGVTVSAVDVTGSGTSDIGTGPGANSGPQVKVFRGTTLAQIQSYTAFGGLFAGGVFVGGRA